MNASFIKNGKEVNYLYQWDVDQVMKLTGFQSLASTDVHFSNNREGKAIVVSGTVDADGNLFAVVPNVLLEDYRMIYAHVYSEGGTIEEATIVVKGRAKPSEIGLKTETIELTSGITKVVQDAEYARLNNLFVYGKSTQDGVPMPDNPIDIVNVKKASITIGDDTVTIDAELRSIGEDKDRLFKDVDGVWKVERNIKRVLCDENTIIKKNKTAVDDYSYFFQFDDKVGYTSICEQLENKKQQSDVVGGADIEKVGKFDSTSSFSIIIFNIGYYMTGENTANVVKQWFKEHNMVILYKIAPKLEILPTKDQQALNAFMMQKGINNILLTTDKDTTGRLVYYKK